METEWVNRLFPDKSKVIRKPPRPDANAVVWTNVFIYGAIGRGKSELANTLLEMAILKYGQDVDGWECLRLIDLLSCVEHSRKPINMYVLDDATDMSRNKDQLHDFFRIRHIFTNSTRMNSGYLITVLGFHRFWNIPVELRASYDFMFLKSIPTNEYDQRFINKVFGSRMIEEFRRLTVNRLDNPEAWSWTLLKDVEMDRVYLLKLKVAKKRYFKQAYSWLYGNIPILPVIRGEEEPEGAEHYYDEEEGL